MSLDYTVQNMDGGHLQSESHMLVWYVVMLQLNLIHQPESLKYWMLRTKSLSLSLSLSLSALDKERKEAVTIFKVTRLPTNSGCRLSLFYKEYLTILCVII